MAPAEAHPGAYLGAGILGIGFWGYLLLVEMVWADFFGRRHLGSIRGVSMVFHLVGNASGSLAAAFLYDLRGDYGDAFRIMVVALLTSFVLLFLARKPETA